MLEYLTLACPSLLARINLLSVKRKNGQLGPGQVTLNGFFGPASGSTPKRSSSSSQHKATSSSGGGSNLGQGAYRLGRASPGPGPSSASAERRKKDQQQQQRRLSTGSPPPQPKRAKALQVEKEPPVEFAIDEDGAICLD